MKPFGRLLSFACAVSAIGIASCATKTDTGSYVLAEDLVSLEGDTFNANSIVKLADLRDTLTLQENQIQAFLLKTPYGRTSFLATYQSNGLRASSAIIQAGLRHGINPLAILVRAQMDQGLIGADFYPSPPSRVEYAFGCGCDSATDCNAQMAGFDRQADCLAQMLETSLMQLAGTSHATVGGWATNVPHLTLDGINVTPAEDSTAALYQYSPLVGAGERGNWLFWNLWEKYAYEIPYQGSQGNGQGQSWIGDACTAQPSCASADFICAGDFPGGMCTKSCSDADPCPNVAGKRASDCIATGGVGYCFASCDHTKPDNCATLLGRAGYTCKTAVLATGSGKQTKDICTKE